MHRTPGRPGIIGVRHSSGIADETHMTLGKQALPAGLPERCWRTRSTSARRYFFFFFLQIAAPLLLTAHLRFFAQHMPD